MHAQRAVLGLARRALGVRLGRTHDERLLVAEVAGPAFGVEDGNVVRAGIGAHLAADALLLVDEHFAVRALVDRLHRADLHAGRIVAVHAAHAEPVDDVVADVFVALDLFPEDAGSDLVFFLAGDRAGKAPGAAVDVDDDAVTGHGEPPLCLFNADADVIAARVA